MTSDGTEATAIGDLLGPIEIGNSGAGGESAIAGGGSAIAGGGSAIAGGGSAIAGGESAIPGRGIESVTPSAGSIADVDGAGGRSTRIPAIVAMRTEPTKTAVRAPLAQSNRDGWPRLASAPVPPATTIGSEVGVPSVSFRITGSASEGNWSSAPV